MRPCPVVYPLDTAARACVSLVFLHASPAIDAPLAAAAVPARMRPDVKTRTLRQRPATAAAATAAWVLSGIFAHRFGQFARGALIGFAGISGYRVNTHPGTVPPPSRNTEPSDQEAVRTFGMLFCVLNTRRISRTNGSCCSARSCSRVGFVAGGETTGAAQSSVLSRAMRSGQPR